MASLPEGWDFDYDGSRWFYRYKPTGVVQYHFPKPGDEYPEYFDSFAPVPDLAPEERLESDRQLKRRSTTDGKTAPSSASAAERKSRKNAGAAASATLGGPDDGGWGHSFDSFGYLGPGGYTDISPLNEEEEEGRAGEGAAGSNKQNGEGSNKGVGSPAAASAALTPMTSAGTTPNVPNSVVAAAGTPPVPAPAVPAEPPDPTAGIPMLHSESLPYELPDAAHMGASNSHPLAQTAQITSPVGFLAELATVDTAACADETAPVELPSNEMLYGQFGVGGAAPVELPHEPVEPKPAAPVAVENTAPLSTTVETARPPLLHQQTAPAAPPSAAKALAQAGPGPSGQYKPFRAPVGVEENRRSSMVAGDLSKLRAQHPLGIVPGTAHGGQEHPQRTDSMSPQPLLVRKSTAPSGRADATPSEQVSASSLQHAPSVLKPAANPAAQGRQALGHVPSVLKPARGREQSLSSADARASPFRPQPKAYMSGSGNTHNSPERGASRQAAEPPAPGVLQRVNTLPDQLPSQAMLFFPEPKKKPGQGPAAAAALPAVAELGQPHRPHSISHFSGPAQPPPILQTADHPQASMPAELTPTAVQAPAEMQGQPAEETQTPAHEGLLSSREGDGTQVYDEVLAMVQHTGSHGAKPEPPTAEGAQIVGSPQAVSLDNSIPVTPPLFSRPSPFSQDSTSTAPIQTVQPTQSDSVTRAREVHSESPAPEPCSISMVSSPSEGEQQSVALAQAPATAGAVSDESQRYSHPGFSGFMPSKQVSYTSFSVDYMAGQVTPPSKQPTPPPVPKKIPEHAPAQTPPSSFSTPAVESPPVASSPASQPNLVGSTAPPPAPKPIPASVYVVSRPASTASISGAVAPPPSVPSFASPPPQPVAPSQHSPPRAHGEARRVASPAPQPDVAHANPPQGQETVTQQTWQAQAGQIHHGHPHVHPGHLPATQQPGFPSQAACPAASPATFPGQQSLPPSQYHFRPTNPILPQVHPGAAYQPGPAAGINGSAPAQTTQTSNEAIAQPINSVHRVSLSGPQPSMSSTPPPAQQGLHLPSISGSPAVPASVSAPANRPALPPHAAASSGPSMPPISGPVTQVLIMDSRASSPAPSLREAVAQPIKRQSAGSIMPIQIKRQSGQQSPQQTSSSQMQSQESAQDMSLPTQPPVQNTQPGQPRNVMQQSPPRPSKIPHEQLTSQQPPPQRAQGAPQQASQWPNQHMPQRMPQQIPQQTPNPAPQSPAQHMSQKAEQKMPHQPISHQTQQRPGPPGPPQGTPAGRPSQHPVQGTASGQPQPSAALPHQHMAHGQYPQQQPKLPLPHQRQGSIPNQAGQMSRPLGPASVQNALQPPQHQRQSSNPRQSPCKVQPVGQVPPGPIHGAGPPAVPVAQGTMLPAQTPTQGTMPSKPQSIPVHMKLQQAQSNAPKGPQPTQPGKSQVTLRQGQQPAQQAPQQGPPQGHHLHHFQTAPLSSQNPQGNQQKGSRPVMQQQPHHVSQPPPNAAGTSVPGHQRMASMPLKPGTEVPQVQQQGQMPPAQAQQQKPRGTVPGSQGVAPEVVPSRPNPGFPPQMQQMLPQMGPGQPPNQTIYMMPQQGMPPQPMLMGQPLPPGVFMQYPQQPGMPVTAFRPGPPQPQVAPRPGVSPMHFARPQMAPGQAPANSSAKSQALAPASPASPSSTTAVKKQGMFSKLFGSKEPAQQYVPGTKPPGGPVYAQTAPPPMQGLSGPARGRPHTGLNTQTQVPLAGAQQVPSHPQQPNQVRVQQTQTQAKPAGTAPPATVPGQRRLSKAQPTPQNPAAAVPNVTAPNIQPRGGQNDQVQPSETAARGASDQSQTPALFPAPTVPVTQPQQQAPPPQGIVYAQAPAPEQQTQPAYLEPGAAAEGATDTDAVSLMEPEEPEETEVKGDVHIDIAANAAAGDVAVTATSSNGGWGNTVNYDGDDWGDDDYGY